MRPNKPPHDRDRRTSFWAAGLVALVLIGHAPDARAQNPEAKAAASPLQLWDSALELVRLGQDEQAVPYLNAFLRSRPDEATLLEIRDRDGVESILRLNDSPSTRPLAQPILNLVTAATRRNATRPDRIEQFIADLTRTQEEQSYAVDRLKEAGPYAVPALVRAVSDTGRSAEDRALIVANMGRLARPAVPALLGVLDSPNAGLVAASAEALGRIGDPRAIPYLTPLAAPDNDSAPARGPARRAIERLTGRPFTSQPKPPVRVLTDEAWKYERHAVAFPGDEVELWTWTNDGPAPRRISRREAEATLGLRFARQALELAPTDVPAQVVFLSLALDHDPVGALPTALAAGPTILGEVLRAAIADGHSDLAVSAALALGRVTDRDALASAHRVAPLVGPPMDSGGACNPGPSAALGGCADLAGPLVGRIPTRTWVGRPNGPGTEGGPVSVGPPPLVEALTAPNCRVQFAAAQALVELEPRRPFAGSSLVVPILSRFVGGEHSVPKVVIIDGNIDRGNQIGSLFRSLGYNPMVAASGDHGFELAADSAGVEAIVLEPSVLQGAWRTIDTLANIRADARTAGIPILILYPEDLSRVQSFIDQTARPQAEREPNDRQSQANLLSFTTNPHQARVSGSLPDADVFGDYFTLGNLVSGAEVSVAIDLPPGSDLKNDDTILSLEFAGSPTALAPSKSGQLNYAVTVPGTYVLRIQGVDRRGSVRRRDNRADYVLNVIVTDPHPTAPGSAEIRDRLDFYAATYPRIAFLSPFTTPDILKRQLDREFGRMGVRPLSDAERPRYAQAAALLLSRLAGEPGSPFETDVPAAGSALGTALNLPETGPAASTALADVPSVDAQRGLADAVLDETRPAPIRVEIAAQLARSIQRFGPLVSADQEVRLAKAFDGAQDPALRGALAAVIGALRPKPDSIGRRLQTYRRPITEVAPPAPTPAPAAPPVEPPPPPEPQPEAEPAAPEPAAIP